MDWFLSLDLDLTQAKSRYQLQEQISTDAEVCRAKVVLMQDEQNERVQQTADLLGLRPDGYARLLAARDQVCEERPVAGQVLLKFFGRDSAKELAKITACEKLHKGDCFK